MIYLFMLGVALVVMLPLLLAFGGSRRLRNRRETALALHRAQLAELARDLADHRIAPGEYAAARLEVERRLLAADGFEEPAQTGNARVLLFATIVAVPVMAFALYLPGSTPHVPSEPNDQWVALQQQNQRKLDAFIAALRAHLASLAPNSADASQGQAYLAEALAEQAGAITPEALALFKQSLADAPAQSSWRLLDEERVAQATTP